MNSQKLCWRLFDASTALLLATNLLALVSVYHFDVSLTDVMLMYWFQSISIGVVNVIRILTVKHFSTERFFINGRRVTEASKAKRAMAAFFTIHFGLFHAGLLAFILGDSPGHIHWNVVLTSAVAFFCNHLFSFFYNREQEAERKTTIGFLMFFPYIRVLPMHFTLLFGGHSAILFMSLKTIADVAMHTIEHRKKNNRSACGRSLPGQ